MTTDDLRKIASLIRHSIIDVFRQTRANNRNEVLLLREFQDRLASWASKRDHSGEDVFKRFYRQRFTMDSRCLAVQEIDESCRRAARSIWKRTDLFYSHVDADMHAKNMTVVYDIVYEAVESVFRRDGRDSRESRDGRDGRDDRESRDIRESRESRESIQEGGHSQENIKVEEVLSKDVSKDEESEDVSEVRRSTDEKPVGPPGDELPEPTESPKGGGDIVVILPGPDTIIEKGDVVEKTLDEIVEKLDERVDDRDRDERIEKLEEKKSDEIVHRVERVDVSERVDVAERVDERDVAERVDERDERDVEEIVERVDDVAETTDINELVIPSFARLTTKIKLTPDIRKDKARNRKETIKRKIGKNYLGDFDFIF